MGILKSYIEGGTKLKSLKFGDGKFTSQPFITTPLPSDDKVVTKPATPFAAYADGMMRGPMISVQRSARDVIRLTKYMATPSGVQFALKQNLLSRVAVGTETSGFFNEAIYTPLSTLAQAGVGVLGIHLNKQGLLPTSLKKYGETIYNANLNDPNKYTDNRLVDLHFTSIEEPSEYDTNLYTYKGGPGSILGIGKTKIRYATEGDGVIPLRVMGSNSLDPKTYLVPKGGDKNFAPSIDDDTFKQSLRDKFIPILGASVKYDLYSKTTIASTLSKSKSNLDWLVNNNPSYSVYESGSLTPKPNISSYLVPGRYIEVGRVMVGGVFKPKYNYDGLSLNDNLNERLTLTSGSYHSPINDQLIRIGREIVDKLEFTQPDPLDISPKIDGYRKYSSTNTLLVDSRVSSSPSEKYIVLNQGNSGYLANLNKNVGWYTEDKKLKYDSHFLNGVAKNVGPDFRKVNRSVRGFVDYPDAYDYVTKTSEDVVKDGDYFTLDQASKVVDRIYYDSGTKRKSTEFGIANDLITFRIDIINPSHPSQAPESLTFRAYIDNLSDNYSPDWNSQTYMGRGEKFHKYNSFDRKISLGFTVAAEGEHHRDKMYSHLNQLVSSLTPTYTAQGYMAGNIHKLTVGNYINAQYGIINGMTYEIMDESPWDIESGKQLPMYIKVTGFQFTPIHNFRPEYKYVAPELPLIKEEKNSPKFVNQHNQE